MKIMKQPPRSMFPVESSMCNIRPISIIMAGARHIYPNILRNFFDSSLSAFSYIGFRLILFTVCLLIIGSVMLIVILINTKDKRIERKIKPKEYKETDNKTIINDVVEVIKPNNR